jgi:anaerobic magnesium-protoporphyrin IX monomethyl ester cyclase
LIVGVVHLRVILINIPHPAIGSRIPDDHLPPLGLLAVGGPLIDDGHDVSLIDGEFGPMPEELIVEEAAAQVPDVVMFGHSGSSSGHPIIARVARAIRARLPDCTIIYGGVHPTYFWRDLLAQEPWLDIIVRGEGEETARQLLRALEDGTALSKVRGLAFRHTGQQVATGAAPVIRDLDAYRVGWELIDHSRYRYWGGKRAVVVQFSRGCPHLCTYCGQRGFWTRWRHRDPVRFAAEIARLHREEGVQVFNFADENPSAGRKAWRSFLEALIAEKINVTLVGSTRADDIVRDADFLHLYKQAGFERFLMGTENTDEDTLRLIKKGSAISTDREAIRLLRKHNILSMATWVAGFSHQTDRDMLHALRQLISYDPDQIQALYVVPHRWTPYFAEATERDVVQSDPTKWDYKHQVLGMTHMTPWRLFLWVKFIEAALQLRPKALRRLLWNREPKIRHAIRWYYRMGRRVWLHEMREFLLRDKTRSTGISVGAFVGSTLAQEEEAMALV